MDKEKGALKIGSNEVGVRTFIQTGYDERGTFVKQQQSLHPNGELNVIYMQTYNTFLIVDNAMFESTYIQLFVLENADGRFFEPISLEPYAKIYRLKI